MLGPELFQWRWLFNAHLICQFPRFQIKGIRFSEGLLYYYWLVEHEYGLNLHKLTVSLANVSRVLAASTWRNDSHVTSAPGHDERVWPPGSTSLHGSPNADAAAATGATAAAEPEEVTDRQEKNEEGENAKNECFLIEQSNCPPPHRYPLKPSQENCIQVCFIV